MIPGRHFVKTVNVAVMQSSDKLTPCPSSPNCVSSQSLDRKHAIEPLRYSGSRDDARQRMLAVLNSLERVRIVQSENDYVHAEFRSRLFGFIDDVELYFAEEDGLIHVRSASRVGYSDLGANRKRVERIRRMFEE